VLAYLFWHRPQPGGATEEYEQVLRAFHGSLAHRPPVGLRATCSFRVAELPWLAAPGPEGTAPVGGYEDWYLLEDYAALGILNEAAVGRGHRTAHDHAARRLGAGAGGLYALQEGEEQALHAAPLAVWVARGPGSAAPAMGELLGDGAPPGQTGLWRRQLVLGPAPEFCLLAPGVPAGVAPSRLPDGWSAQVIAREVLTGAK
jgi:hypothetical protein